MPSIPLHEKCSQPQPSRAILSRTSLVSALHNAYYSNSPYKMILLCAPAGYGKTTLLVDSIQTAKTLSSWYFLDRSDIRIDTFIHTLIGSIKQAVPGFGQKFDAEYIQSISNALNDLSQFERKIDDLLVALATEIPQRFLLCICNYHEVNEDEHIQKFMNYLLNYLPSHCTICIESRSIPTLHLAMFLTHNQIFGLGSSALRFSAQEISDLSRLQSYNFISVEDAEALTQAFEGWIAGILLATQLGDQPFSHPILQNDNAWGAPALYTDSQTLYSYIENEVFKTEQEAYDFLKNCSILQELTVAACNALTCCENADGLLTSIENRGLFVTRVRKENTQRAYKCHPAIRKLLQHDIQKTQPKLLQELHRKAALYFFSHYDYEQVIEHALIASADDIIVDLILRVSDHMYQNKDVRNDITRWIDHLPRAILENNPQLLLLRATLYILQYESTQASPLLDKAYRLVQQSLVSNEEFLPALEAKILYSKSNILFKEGDYEQSQQLCQKALVLMPIDEIVFRIQTHIRFGDCAIVLGNYTGGIKQLQLALQLCGHSTVTVQTSHIHTSLASAYDIIGNYALSEHHRARAIGICDQLGDVRTKINNLIWIGIVKRDGASLSEAEEMFKQIIEMSRQDHFLSGEAYGLLNLGSIYIDEGSLSQALTVTENSFAISHQIQDTRLINFNMFQLGLIYLYMGDFDTALLCVQQANIKTEGITSGEYIQRELTLGTIYLFQKDYQQAYKVLQSLQTISESIGQKRTTLECTIRLAACQLAQKKEQELKASIDKIVTIIAQGYFEQVAYRELKRFSQLWRIVQPRLHKESSTEEVTSTHEELHQETLQPSCSNINTVHTLQILAFGEPTVILDGIPITRWRMTRSMELYFFLLHLDHAARREQIIDALWSSIDDHINQNLRSTIFYLRKAVGESCITYSEGRYSLSLDARYGDNVSYDVKRFQKKFTQAKQAFEAKDIEQTKHHLCTAVDLYRGDYLQSFYSDWCMGPRDELRYTYTNGLHQLALIAWDEREIEQCIEYWHRLLAVDNCSEEAHYGLMRSYKYQGKHRLAIRQYQRYADVLQEELSIKPSPVMQKYYSRLTSDI